MSIRDKGKDSNKLTQVVADARRNMQERERTYREKALKMYPHVCGRCGREFSGKQLRELTVHHRDHNHDNNPPTAAIGSCFASTATTMSTVAWRWPTPMITVRRPRNPRRPTSPTNPLPLWKPCSRARRREKNRALRPIWQLI